MIKIRLWSQEVTLNGDVWSCEDSFVARILNYQTNSRPFAYEPNRERAVARYIVALLNEGNDGTTAEIIYDNNEDTENEDNENQNENVNVEQSQPEEAPRKRRRIY